MRHIFKLILFAVVMLALGGIANGQSIVTGTGYTTQLIYQRGGYGADSVFGIPVRDTFCNNFLSPVPFRCKGRITIQPSTGKMYYHNGSYWEATSSGGGSGADSSIFVTHTQLDDSLDAVNLQYVTNNGNTTTNGITTGGLDNYSSALTLGSLSKIYKQYADSMYLNAVDTTALAAKFWRLGGNTLNQDTAFGSRSNHTITFISNNTSRGRLVGSGEWEFGTRTSTGDVTVQGTNPLSKIYRVNNTVNNTVGWDYQLNNSSNAQTTYAQSKGGIVSNTAGAESGFLSWYTRNAGTLAEGMRLTNDKELWVNSTTDLGNYKLQVTGEAIVNGNRPIHLLSSAGTILFNGVSGTNAQGTYFQPLGGTTYAGFNALMNSSGFTRWSIGGLASDYFTNPIWSMDTVGNVTQTGSLTAPALYGSTAANGDVTIRGTTSATKTTSYALIQDNGGLTGIGNSAPDEVLTVGNATENSTNRKALKFGVGGYAAPGNFSTASNGDKIIFYNGVDFDGRFGVSDMGDVWLKAMSTSTANQSFGSFNVYTGQTSGAPTRRFMVSGTGNVSVADFTPLYLFTVGNGDLFGVNTAGKIPAYAGSAPTNGQLLIGHTANGTFEKATLTAGTGVAITNGAGSITIAADNNETITISSAGTLNLVRSNNYIFNGTTSTWTIPAVASSTGIVYKLKNRGSGNITINTTAAANELYTTLATNTYTLTPGSAIILVADGTFWNVE